MSSVFRRMVVSDPMHLPGTKELMSSGGTTQPSLQSMFGFGFFFKIYFALLSVWVSVYIWVCTLVGMLVTSRGGLQMAWSWNYKHLWVPEIELWSSKRVVNNLKCWAISSSSSFNRFYCLNSVLLILSFCVWLDKSMCVHGNVVTFGGQKY